MDQNQPYVFTETLACVFCARPVPAKKKAVRITNNKKRKTATYHYRCAGCLTVYHGFASASMLQALKERGVMPGEAQDRADEALTKSKDGDALLLHFVSNRRKLRVRKKRMSKYLDQFVRELKSNDNLAAVVLTEGNWKSN